MALGCNGIDSVLVPVLRTGEVWVVKEKENYTDIEDGQMCKRYKFLFAHFKG